MDNGGFFPAPNCDCAGKLGHSSPFNARVTPIFAFLKHHRCSSSSPCGPQFPTPSARCCSDTGIHWHQTSSLTHPRAHTCIKVINNCSWCAICGQLQQDLHCWRHSFVENLDLKSVSFEELLFWVPPRLRWVEGLLLF